MRNNAAKEKEIETESDGENKRGEKPTDGLMETERSKWMSLGDSARVENFYLYARETYYVGSKWDLFYPSEFEL